MSTRSKFARIDPFEHFSIPRLRFVLCTKTIFQLHVFSALERISCFEIPFRKKKHFRRRNKVKTVGMINVYGIRCLFFKFKISFQICASLHTLHKCQVTLSKIGYRIAKIRMKNIWSKKKNKPETFAIGNENN